MGYFMASFKSALKDSLKSKKIKLKKKQYVAEIITLKLI